MLGASLSFFALDNLRRSTLADISSPSSVFGFLIGTVLAGSGLYYYVVDEYKISNRLLVEDIYVSRPLLIDPSLRPQILQKAT